MGKSNGWRNNQSLAIQCAHGDLIAYPLAAIKLEIQGKLIFINSAVSDTLPQSVLVGTDIPVLLEILQIKCTGEGEEPLEKVFVEMTRSHTWGQPTKNRHQCGSTKTSCFIRYLEGNHRI